MSLQAIPDPCSRLLQALRRAGRQRRDIRNWIPLRPLGLTAIIHGMLSLEQYETASELMASIRVVRKGHQAAIQRFLTRIKRVDDHINLLFERPPGCLDFPPEPEDCLRRSARVVPED